MGKVLAGLLLLVGLVACGIFGGSESREPAAVPTVTPNIPATREAAEQAAVRDALVAQLMATIQAPLPSGDSTSAPDSQPSANPQSTPQGLAPQTPGFPATPAPQLGAAGARTVDLIVGDVAGARGESATVDIVIDSQGQLVFGFQLNLTFDEIALPSAVGSAGSIALPNGWILAANLAKPGELRFLGVSIDGKGSALSGDILKAQFDIAADSDLGPISIENSLVAMFDTDRVPLPVNAVNGTVNVIARN